MNFTPPTDKRIARLIDANLDRAREGLRVIEDWCRFGLENKALVVQLKNWRHQLSLHHHEIYKEARSASSDQGALLNHPAQINRKATNDVVAANCSRIQEALRVLEEFTRISDPQLAKNASNIRYEIYELELTLTKVNIKNKRVQKLKNCNLYLITTPQEGLLSTVSATIKEGVKMVQYRCKEGNDRQKIQEAKELSSLCKMNNALLIINDRVDIALAADADGIHLGQNDMPTEIARELLGEERIIGRSTHSIAELRKAEQERCDYVGIGPVFPSHNKTETKSIGLNSLSEMLKEACLPCFAIGGINTSNVKDVVSEGASRIAVLGAIMDTNDPILETRNLFNKLP